MVGYGFVHARAINKYAESRRRADQKRAGKSSVAEVRLERIVLDVGEMHAAQVPGHELGETHCTAAEDGFPCGDLHVGWDLFPRDGCTHQGGGAVYFQWGQLDGGRGSPGLGQDVWTRAQHEKDEQTAVTHYRRPDTFPDPYSLHPVLLPARAVAFAALTPDDGQPSGPTHAACIMPEMRADVNGEPPTWEIGTRSQPCHRFHPRALDVPVGPR